MIKIVLKSLRWSLKRDVCEEAERREAYCEGQVQFAIDGRFVCRLMLRWVCARKYLFDYTQDWLKIGEACEMFFLPSRLWNQWQQWMKSSLKPRLCSIINVIALNTEPAITCFHYTWRGCDDNCYFPEWVKTNHATWNQQADYWFAVEREHVGI